MNKAIYSSYLKAKSLFAKKKGTLVYVGLNKGSGFDCIFRNYEKCYGFEPNPKLYAKLKEKYKKYSNVFIYNYAVADRAGKIEFNISSNGGASSSIGTFSEDWGPYNSGKVRMISTIRVDSINLCDFLKQQEIDKIDAYVSDIQGYDLHVLKTLTPFLYQEKISSITCEVTKNEHRNIYSNLPDNSESGFAELLNQNYICIAKGWGILKDGVFEEVPTSWWEMDCKWVAKSLLESKN